jgi:23S rRNA (adenine2503-C2)-methyltransferase
MRILRNIKVPTGNILIVSGEKGNLEMLSLGDYGKNINIKCDALGLSRELKQVKHTKLLPLTEKWVITISSQYGCSMNCNFCDVPKVGPGINATTKDLVNQVLTGLKLHSEIKNSKRLNIHFARMGEPTFNNSVLRATELLYQKLNGQYILHPVISTIMPKNNKLLKNFILDWMDLKNNMLEGEAGLQISINSTDEKERKIMFNNNALSLRTISNIMKNIRPRGRKITLNFAIANYIINPRILLKYFNPRFYIIKLTPMHKTLTAIENDIKTKGDYTTYYPYKKYEISLKKAGYDVLVFIASLEEDLGRITCGNAILSGAMPLINYKELK